MPLCTINSGVSLAASSVLLHTGTGGRVSESGTIAVSTVALQVDGCSLHPVPGGAVSDDSRQLLKRAAAFSLALHLVLVAAALIVTYWRQSAVVGTPQEEILDITIVPLSALDTVLPRGSPISPELPKSESVAPEQPREKPLQEQTESDPQKKTETAKKIVASKTLPVKHATPDASNTQTTNIASTHSSSQPLGVANGDAIPVEQARISYQDMVATLLARAKRYPERALKRGMTGEGSIRLEISADGSLADFEIIRSTETPILDEELKAMVERAAPFPAFPSDLRKNRLALVVPIAFRLKS